MEEKSGLNRRAWLKRFVAGGLLSPPVAYSYGRGWERHRPVVERVEIHLAGIGPAFDGFRIVHISDLHVEPNVDLPLLAQTVEIINGLKPDLVAITGDFITHDASRMAELSEPLSDLRAGASVVASLGNHDVWAGERIVKRDLLQWGVKVLQNQGFGLSRGGEELWIAGLDSAWAGRPDVGRALKGKSASAPCAALIHEPDFADRLTAESVPILQLAGHTHGGQVCLPGGTPLLLPTWGKKYAKGLYQVGQQQVYVNRGLGTLGPKARFACAPEITEITLCGEG